MHNLTAHELSSVHHLDLLTVIVTFKKMYVCCNYGKCNYGKCNYFMENVTEQVLQIKTGHMGSNQKLLTGFYKEPGETLGL